MAVCQSRMGETIGDCITYTTTNDAIMLKEAGELQSLLSNNLYDYTSLTLAGPMNGDDLNCLRKMMGRNLDETDTPGKLASIDMTDVKLWLEADHTGLTDMSKTTLSDKDFC